ncbi:MAG: hypothetical protein ACOYMA_01470 [Bacteroidia bacterium]
MNNNKINFVLLLTACIEPTQFKNKVQRNDSLVRLSDYKAALKMWLHHKDEKITTVIFAENSGYDLTEIEHVFLTENKFSRNYQIFQTKASKVPNGLHYGYSELELIDDAINQITLLKDNDYIIKSTGRVYFPKISLLTQKLLNTQVFIADSRRFNFFVWHKNYVLSNLFVFNIKWYKNNLLAKKEIMINLKISHFETLLFYLLNKKQSSNAILLRFPFNINPVGVGAHWDVNYQSFNKKLSYIIRAIFRKILPQVWI